ncbi:iron-siderophore ABC transporter substrate-binding protein [Nocardioides alcanivorans]|uniref:iron-siderophore ABC transporter substrate-binding protein n=1 Tax=Nocardioides alcanivorans TaxID=2897352 RepID=UPI001F48E4F5|nr:iron-siderophore ABC transporter substrate-binding protein [Nocardioides alcanivorans]
MKSSRLRTAGAVLLLSTTFLLGACGSGTDDDQERAGGDAAAFPVTIDSALGEAEILEAPKRVITLGQGSAETSIALGNIPVGMEEYAWGADPETGYLPWVHDAVTEAGGELPELVGSGEELDTKKILSLDPDVILAPWSGLTQEQFDQLNAIAPTVAYPDKAWSVNWDEQIEIIGKALGQSEAADALIDDLEDQLAAAAEEHPEYADYTFSYVYTTPDTLGVFLPDEQRVAVVRALGLQVDPAVDDMEEVEGTDSAIIGYENADQLDDSDLIFTFYSDEAQKKQALANKLYAQIPAIQNDAVVASDENSFVTASSMINPLTLPYALERYVPMIDEAIAKVAK